VAVPARCDALHQPSPPPHRTKASHLRHPHVPRPEERNTYRTPINVFRRGDAYFFFLTYGSDAQWVKNVLAAGSCSLETRGRVVELVEPVLVNDPELRPAPPVVRFVERRIAGATEYLRMRAS
jgi:hypothetical protein